MSTNKQTYEAWNLRGATGIDGLAAGTAAYNENLFRQGQTATVLVANALAFDLTANSVLGANPAYLQKGGFFVTMQPRGSDVFIRLRSTNGTPATTITAASNGFKMLDGQVYRFWITTNERYMDVMSTANCALFWWRSSSRTDGASS